MSFCWTKRAIERLVWMSLDRESSHAIARRLGCIERTVRKMQWELELAPRRDVHRWTRKERALLRKLYATTPTQGIAKQLGVRESQVWQQAAKLGLHKDLELIREMARERTARPDHPSVAFRFPKGHVPANKGQRRPGWSAGRMRETQFKPGERSGFAERNWKPVGAVVADPEGFLRVKIRERINGLPAGWDKSIWPLLHHRTWELHHGPIPPGHKVVFRDGDRANCVIENLELLSDAELMRRNTIHNRYPKEVVNTIMLLGAVKRRLRERCQKTQ